MELLKLLSANEIVAQVLSFLLLLFLLRIFAWKKILQMLDARAERIASEFKKIDDTQTQVAKMKEDYEARLSGIEEAAQKRLQEAVAKGREVTEEIRKQAHQDAQDIIENARANIKHELNTAKEELKEKIIDLTIKATENLIEERLTEEDNKKLVKDFLERIDKAA